jgi:tRNA threonylcarbamoyladenosine biosynthesis protein TsaE
MPNIHHLRSEADTQQLAVQLAAQAKTGDVFALQGDLGAGKTAFARYFIQALASVSVDVASPTFTLLQTYDTSKGEVWHYDLYRIENEAALVELALEDATSHIVLIEWPERLGSYRLPISATLTFTILGDGSREVTIISAKETV